jgi:hypothetical protein
MSNPRNYNTGVRQQWSSTRTSKSIYDTHARLSGAVLLAAFSDLKKALSALDANPKNKEAEDTKNETVRFLLSESPWHYYLAVVGHELPTKKTLKRMGVEV